MRRVAFTLKVKPDLIDEYRRRHADVWPEMLDALRETGWKNYSIFLQPDGTLLFYVETPDFKAALAGMAEKDVNRRWQEEMAPFFENLCGEQADQSFLPLEEVFHLD
ncbi:MAG: L-rhamnose mutarotase [Methanoregulaceae archaeon]|nr:L-rhamnose mutarotase [Methanoregulaceae archaeon]